MFNELFKIFSNYHFIFKLHRKDDINLFQKNLDKTNNKNFNVIGYNDSRFSNNIFFWIKSSDIIITTGSTIIIESLLYDKQVITIDLFDEISSLEIIKSDISMYSSSKIQLIKNIREFEQEQQQEREKRIQMNKNSLYKYQDNKSSSRVAEILIGLVTN